MPDAVDTVVCAPDDGWKYHPKHVEQFPDINKLCDVASCWIYEYTGILLGARPILRISRIKVKVSLLLYPKNLMKKSLSCCKESDSIIRFNAKHHSVKAKASA